MVDGTIKDYTIKNTIKLEEVAQSIGIETEGRQLQEVAAEISDILFGIPSPVATEVDMGCLKEDHVNIIVQGHEPYLLESMLESVNDRSLINAAKEAGARGINLAGMCCSGLEMLSRHGVPHAGNFMPTEAIMVAGVVGCVNPRVKQDWLHVELVKQLIKDDVLVIQTGCSQISLAKAGLCTPEAAHLARPGLSEICEAVGMPPVLGMGACVDNSRILIACAEMVRVGGLGDSISDLPVAGAAPEWYSEKAITIGHYFVASGVFTVFGVTFPIIKQTKFYKHLFEKLETYGLGKWGFTPDPYEMARMMIDHIDKKRVALGIDRARERILVDMADRRRLDAG